jgi:hypothetical protein
LTHCSKSPEQRALQRNHGQNKTGQTQYQFGAVQSIKYDRNYRQTIVKKAGRTLLPHKSAQKGQKKVLKSYDFRTFLKLQT